MKKGSGGRITSLTLEEKGGWVGGREREGGGGSEMRRETLQLRQPWDPAGWRRGPGELEGGGVASQSEAGGGGGSSPHCARSSCRRRLDPAAMAAAVAEAAPFRPQAAAPRLLPIRRGHGNPATASVPRGPLPRPRQQLGRPPAPRLCSVPAQEVSALCPQPRTLSAAAGPAPPRFLPSFVTRPGRRRQRQHKPAFARVRGCSVWGALSAQPPCTSPLPLPLPTLPPPPSSPTQPYTAQRPAARVTGVWESPPEPHSRPLRLGAEARTEPITDVVCLRLLPEKADRPEKPIRKWRWKATPKERKMPKAAERKGWIRLVRWLAGGDIRQWQQWPIRVAGPHEKAWRVEDGETQRRWWNCTVGRPRRFVIGWKTPLGAYLPRWLVKGTGLPRTVWPVRTSPPSPRWGEESEGRASIKRRLIGRKLRRWSWGKRERVEPETRGGGQSALTAVQSQDLAAVWLAFGLRPRTWEMPD